MMNARGGFPSGPFHDGPPSALTSTKRALRGWTRAIHSEAQITRFIGAKNIDKVWRSRLNHELNKDVGVEDWWTWTGNTVDPCSGWGEIITCTEGSFSPSPVLVGESISEVLSAFLCGVETSGG